MPDDTRSGSQDPAQGETPTDAGVPPTADDLADATRTFAGVAWADGPAGQPADNAFALQGEIARGGMGVVYRARDAALARDVAVKVLRDHYAPDSPAARRFLEEARISGQLQHPGIPPVYQVGRLPDGRLFLAMKLIKGVTLDELLADRPDPAADRGRFVAVFEQVCQAVGYAHAHGVVHRDLKPSNVMVGAFGEVQVMDWGIAKVLSPARDAAPQSESEPAAATAIRSLRQADEAFTQAGSILGTPAYMPREQAIGAIDQIDARSDVFSLGGLLCAVLTGKPPYVGANAEATRQLAAVAALGDAFARLDASGTEPALVALCKRCLSARKEDRPADASEVAQAVAALRSDAEQRARKAELDRAQVEVRAAEQRKRWVVRVVALLILLGATLLATGFAYWAGSEFNRASKYEEDAKRVFEIDKRLREYSDRIDESRREANTAHNTAVRNCFGLFELAFAGEEQLTGPADEYLRRLLRLTCDTNDRYPTPGPGAGREETAARLGLAGRLHTRLGEHDRALDRFATAKAHRFRLLEEKPQDEQRLRDFGWAAVSVGDALRAVARPDAALAEYDEAIDRLTAAGISSLKGSINEYRQCRALVLMDLGRYADAQQEWDRVIAGDGNELPTRHGQALCFARTDPSRAAEEADRWVRRVDEDEAREFASSPFSQYESQVSDGEGGWTVIPDKKDDRPGYDSPAARAEHLRTRVEERLAAARVHAAVAGQVAPEQRDAHALRAVELLRRVRDAGYFRLPARVARLNRDREFDPIRYRPDFRELLAQPWPPVAPAPREAKR